MEAEAVYKLFTSGDIQHFSIMTKYGLVLEGEAVCWCVKNERGLYSGASVGAGAEGWCVKKERGLYSISMETCGEMYLSRRGETLHRKKAGIDINRCIRRLKKRR